MLSLPLRSMPLNEVGYCWAVLSRPAGSLAGGKMANILRFTVRGVTVAVAQDRKASYARRTRRQPSAALGVCAQLSLPPPHLPSQLPPHLPSHLAPHLPPHNCPAPANARR